MFSRLHADIATIRERDPAARSNWEVLTLYPGLHALQFHRFAHGCWKRGFHWTGRAISQFSRWATGIEIHPGAKIGQGVFIDHGMGIVIGETAEIGDGCTLYQGVTLGGTSLERGAKRHPTLGKNVVVSAGAKVLGGFTVGDGAKIGSNAVVVKPVPAGATAVGIPARIIQAEDVLKREELAGKMGFSAYGITQQDDPLSLAMRGLIDHAGNQEHQITLLWQALERLQERLQERAPASGDKGSCVPEGAQRQTDDTCEKLAELVGK